MTITYLMIRINDDHNIFNVRIRTITYLMINDDHNIFNVKDKR